MEIIVVDDASDPPVQLDSGTAKPLTVIRLSEASGPSRARNAGIASATGEFISFLDDDDEWLQGTISFQVQALLKSGEGVAAVFGGYEAIHEGRVVYTHVPPQGLDVAARLLREPTFGPPTVMLRRRSLDSVGTFNPDLSRYEDWDLWLRLAERYKIVALPRVLTRVHLNSGPTGRQRLRLYLTMYRRLRPLISEQPVRKKIAIHTWHLKRLVIRGAQATLADGGGKRSWWSKLRRWKQRRIT